MNKLLEILKENIGKKICIAGVLGDTKEILKVVEIENKFLKINNYNIDLNIYIHIKFLSNNMVILNNNSRRSVLLSIA